jgi:parallel beta-helix repeat protein
MGIELANTMSRPPSTVNQNTVIASTHEGISLHNAHALVENNVVSANGLRGIAIAEMSMATVRSNRLDDNADAGIFVLDNSMASVTANVIRAVKPGPDGRADGIRAFYYAEVLLGENTIDGPAGQAITSGYEAVIVPR